MADLRTYGVSFGDGNNGVSHVFPSYYVRTDDPRRLAELATLAEFNPAGRAWARNALYLRDDAEQWAATIDAPPRDEQRATGDTWSDGAPAWFVCEVFPDEEPRADVPQYGNLIAAFRDEVLAMVPESEVA